MTIQKRRAKRTMGEILPGFWIGRMAGVRTIFEMADDDDEEWTVISILSSDSIINTVKDTLKEEQRKFGRPLVQKHVVWDLPDKSHASFLSDKLQEICHVITESLSDHHHNTKGNVHESTNTLSTVDSSWTAASSTTSSISDGPQTTPQQSSSTTTTSRNKNCLVHCARGVSRSAAVCAAWLISAKGYSLMESLDLIRTAREQVNPNMGFLAGLKALEKCFGNIAKAQERLQSRQQRKLLQQQQQQQPDDATTATLASSRASAGGGQEKTATPPTASAPTQTKTAEPRQQLQKQKKNKKEQRARSQSSSPKRQAQPQSTKSQATQEPIMDAGANISAGSDKSMKAELSQQQRQKKEKTKERARSESSSSSSSSPTCVRDTNNNECTDEEQAANAERIEKEELKSPTRGESAGESAKQMPTDTTKHAAEKAPGNDYTINPQEETIIVSSPEAEMQETKDDDDDDDTGVWV